MGFVHNIDPVVLTIGQLEVRWYGIIYALGFLITYFFLYRAVKRGRIDVPRESVDSFMLWLMLAVVLGSRLFHVIVWEPAYYLSNPWEIPILWRGGLAFHGGLIGAIAVTYWFARKHSLSFYRLADVIVLPAALALALGRIANYVNGELWGTVTNVPWCVEFPQAEGCRHPVQLYGAMKRFLIFGYLFLVDRKHTKDGFLFWSFIVLMGAGRFLIDFTRADMTFLGLSTGQYMSIVMVLVGGFFLIRHYPEELPFVKKM